MNNLYDSAIALFDGGWRADDKSELIAEFNLTLEEAEEICDILAEIEK